MYADRHRLIQMLVRCNRNYTSLAVGHPGTLWVQRDKHGYTSHDGMTEVRHAASGDLQLIHQNFGNDVLSGGLRKT